MKAWLRKAAKTAASRLDPDKDRQLAASKTTVSQLRHESSKLRDRLDALGADQYEMLLQELRRNGVRFDGAGRVMDLPPSINLRSIEIPFFPDVVVSHASSVGELVHDNGWRTHCMEMVEFSFRLRLAFQSVFSGEEDIVIDQILQGFRGPLREQIRKLQKQRKEAIHA